MFKRLKLWYKANFSDKDGSYWILHYPNGKTTFRLRKTTAKALQREYGGKIKLAD